MPKMCSETDTSVGALLPLLPIFFMCERYIYAVCNLTVLVGEHGFYPCFVAVTGLEPALLYH